MRSRLDRLEAQMRNLRGRQRTQRRGSK
jgi:hypothetical protein